MGWLACEQAHNHGGLIYKQRSTIPAMNFLTRRNNLLLSVYVKKKSSHELIHEKIVSPCEIVYEKISTYRFSNKKEVPNPNKCPSFFVIILQHAA